MIKYPIIACLALSILVTDFDCHAKKNNAHEVRYAFLLDVRPLSDRPRGIVIYEDNTWAYGGFQSFWYSNDNRKTSTFRVFDMDFKGELYEDGERMMFINPRKNNTKITMPYGPLQEFTKKSNKFDVIREWHHDVKTAKDVCQYRLLLNFEQPKVDNKLYFKTMYRRPGKNWADNWYVPEVIFKPLFDYHFTQNDATNQNNRPKEVLNLNTCLQEMSIVRDGEEFVLQYKNKDNVVYESTRLNTIVDNYQVLKERIKDLTNEDVNRIFILEGTSVSYPGYSIVSPPADGLIIRCE